MKIKITFYCPDCQGTKTKKNGNKSYGKQNYMCKDCERQFTGDHALIYKGCWSELERRICMMPVRGVGIRDIAEIENISIKRVLSALTRSTHKIHPKTQSL